MSALAQSVQSTLQRSGAKYVESAKSDVLTALRSFPQLTPDTETFDFPDGTRKTAFRLKGTIPVVIKGQTYNIPIYVYLWDTHPYYAPICFVNPTSQMVIKESENVDKKGKVYLPYLSEWRFPGYDLNGLLQVMAMVFQERCPVFTKSSSSSSTSRSTPQPSRPSTTPYPMSQSAYSTPTPYPTSGVGAMPTPYPINSPQQPFPASTPYPSHPTPYPPYPNREAPPVPPPPVIPSNTNTIQPEHIRLSLVSAVEDRIRQRLRDTLGTKHAEIASIRQTQQELRDGQTKLKKMVDDMETQQKELEAFIFTYQDKKKELARALEESGGSKEREDLDAAIDATTPLHRQLLDCYAQDLACDDTIYALGQALKHGTLSVSDYLKHVRNVSRRQFIARATMHKCRTAAGLSV